VSHLAEMAGILRPGVVLVDEGSAAGEEHDGSQSHPGEGPAAKATDLPQRRHGN